jgi:hypothetical protein
LHTSRASKAFDQGRQRRKDRKVARYPFSLTSFARIQPFAQQDASSSLVSRRNLLSCGYNNSLLDSVQADIANAEAKYGAPLVPPSFSPSKLVARARNFAFRRHGVGERQPDRGLFQPLEELNTRFGRHMFDARNVDFVPITPQDGVHLIAPLDSSHANFDLLRDFSEQVQGEPSRRVTTADMVRSLTPNFDYMDPAPVCDIDTFIKMIQVRNGGVTARAFRRVPRGTERDPVKIFAAACRRFLRET